MTEVSPGYGKPGTRKDDPAEAHQRHLDEMGVEFDDKLVEGAEARFWWCAPCRLTLDAFIEIDGGPRRVVGEAFIACPKCGNRDLSPEALGERDDAYAGRLKAGTLVEAAYVPPTDPRLIECLREGEGMVDASGIFGMDVAQDQEPKWPRYLCQVIAGVALYLGEKMPSCRPDMGAAGEPDTEGERAADKAGAPAKLADRRCGFCFDFSIAGTDDAFCHLRGEAVGIGDPACDHFRQAKER